MPSLQYDAFFFTAVLVLAYILDLVFGDPERFPHPVRWIGSFIAVFEKALRRFAKASFGQRACGVMLTAVTVVLVYGVTALLLYAAESISAYLYFASAVFAVWASLSIKSLQTEASAVARALKENGLGAARKRLKRIVGRDTQRLSEEAVLRASAETVAENTSDGAVAPLFYFMLGGPALMMAYKAVNTLDSMVGYKNERYRYLGWASARLDDAANFIPARLTAALMVCASFILRYNWKGSLSTVLCDGKKHASPNSGMPEAAVAGALGVRMGGPSTYNGVVCEKPFIGRGEGGFSFETVESAIRIMRLTAFLMVVTVAVVRTIYFAM